MQFRRQYWNGEAEAGRVTVANSESFRATPAALTGTVVPVTVPAGGIGRIPITKVHPVVEGGAHPAKAFVGERIPIRATVFREGHDAVACAAVVTAPTAPRPSTGWLRASPPDGTGGRHGCAPTRWAPGGSTSRRGTTRGRPGSTTPR